MGNTVVFVVIMTDTVVSGTGPGVSRGVTVASPDCAGGGVRTKQVGDDMSFKVGYRYPE